MRSSDSPCIKLYPWLLLLYYSLVHGPENIGTLIPFSSCRVRPALPGHPDSLLSGQPVFCRTAPSASYGYHLWIMGRSVSLICFTPRILPVAAIGQNLRCRRLNASVPRTLATPPIFCFPSDSCSEALVAFLVYNIALLVDIVNSFPRILFFMWSFTAGTLLLTSHHRRIIIIDSDTETRSGSQAQMIVSGVQKWTILWITAPISSPWWMMTA